MYTDSRVIITFTYRGAGTEAQLLGSGSVKAIAWEGICMYVRSQRWCNLRTWVQISGCLFRRLIYVRVSEFSTECWPIIVDHSRGSSGEYSRVVLDEKHPYRTFADEAGCKRGEAGAEAEAERGPGRVIDPTRSQNLTLFPSAQIGDCRPTIFS